MGKIYDTRFQTNLDLLRAYTAREGHPHVPVDHLEPTSAGSTADLGRWVAYVKSRYRRGLLPQERAGLLETIPGWTWDARRPGPKPRSARNDEMRALRAGGASLDALAETYGMSKQRVHQIVGNHSR